MGEDPDAIRREIEETRDRMGDTVEALGYKADVPSRAKEKVSGRMQSMKESIMGAKESVTGTVGGAAGTVSERTPGTEDVMDAARKGAGVAQENPMGLAIGSIAVGFLAGMLIPSTRVENERIGPMADQVKEQARETSQQALEHGKQVAQEVASTAQEHVQEAKEDVKQTAQQSTQEHAQQAREEVGSTTPRNQ
jgi:gas vesicle protein